MLILGIETSCDETSVSLVRNGKDVLSLEIASSLAEHVVTGGIVPEVAARDHVIKLVPTLQKALDSAGVIIDDIDALAVTNGPGLVGSLLSGVVCAQTLARTWKKPLIPVHHIAGHIYANWLERDDDISFPLLVLTASGGHNEIVLMRGHGDFEIIGETLDDAAGEAFDKVARMLNLGYPGGPAISKAATAGNEKAFDLPRPMFHSDSYDFSFSGLKTAVSQKLPSLDMSDSNVVADMAASFEQSVVDVLLHKLMKAAKEYEACEIHISGGVSANKRLRAGLESHSSQNGLRVRYPEKMVYCTDNAAMIAGAAFYSPRSTSQNWNDIDVEMRFGF